MNQNYNFADWELTQMLPKDNPFIDYNFGGFWISEKEISKCLYCFDLYGYSKEIIRYDRIRDAWTWEDIRLYLFEKGYIIKIVPITIKTQEENIVYQPEIIFTSTFETENGIVCYKTYEEARREAILYCLNLINEE